MGGITLSHLKAQSCQKYAPSNALIIAGDQVISCQNRVLGKPKNHNEAIEQLRWCSGQTVDVHTGMAVYCPKQDFKRYFYILG